jgi:hypothetical protein
MLTRPFANPAACKASLVRTPKSGTMALIEAAFAGSAPTALSNQPEFRRHWAAPKNNKGGFKSFEDMKAEQTAEAAAYYGPPQGPCSSFHDTHAHHAPTCFCGWGLAAHRQFAKGGAK